MKKANTSTRLLAVLLALVMTLSLLPLTALAEGDAEPADKSELLYLIELAEYYAAELDPDDYDAEVWTAFTDALETAQIVVADDDATQDDVDDATDALQLAIDAILGEPVGFEPLTDGTHTVTISYRQGSQSFGDDAEDDFDFWGSGGYNPWNEDPPYHNSIFIWPEQITVYQGDQRYEPTATVTGAAGASSSRTYELAPGTYDYKLMQRTLPDTVLCQGSFEVLADGENSDYLFILSGLVIITPSTGGLGHYYSLYDSFFNDIAPIYQDPVPGGNAYRYACFITLRSANATTGYIYEIVPYDSANKPVLSDVVPHTGYGSFQKIEINS